MKVCPKCKVEKSASDFYSDKKSGRLSSRCKECTKAGSSKNFNKDRSGSLAKKRAYYRENKERINLKKREWRDRNLFDVKAKAKDRYQRDKAKHRNGMLRNNYGITSGDYEDMFAKQGGRCKICLADTPKSHRTKYFAVDHCHVTGKVRGLLCHSCNVAIGLLQDSPEVAEAAASYLRGGCKLS